MRAGSGSGRSGRGGGAGGEEGGLVVVAAERRGGREGEGGGRSGRGGRVLWWGSGGVLGRAGVFVGPDKFVVCPTLNTRQRLCRVP